MRSAQNSPLRVAEIPDALLAARAAEGDERALSQLYERHARYVAGVAWRLLGNDADVDDVVQETFLAALEHLGALRDGQAVRPWLASIAARRVMQRFDARSRLRRFVARWTVGTPTRTEPQVRHDVGELARALSRLASEERIPWVLHRVEGETLPEVARIVGVSLATVKRRIARADEALGSLKEPNRAD
jgi:RNA polymerase sigma-70 factor (ECF subfamily)